MTTPSSPTERSPGIPDKTPGPGPGGRGPGRADALGTGGLPQSLAAKGRGGQLGPRGLESRRARRWAAAALSRDCRPLDAWNGYPAEAIGAVFLCQVGDGQFLALQTICPHNGGCVSYDPEKKNFYCPSHGALFDLQGRRLDQKSISPRDLDSLEVEIRDGTEVWVKFERFQDGKSEKIVKT